MQPQKWEAGYREAGTCGIGGVVEEFCGLADILQLPQSTLSSHLQVIRKSGLLVSERCEKWIYYKVAQAYRPLLTPLFKQFGELSQVLADRKAARLAQREDCDCPGPQRLSSLAIRRSSASLIKS